MDNPYERARGIRLAAFDVDGVLTDGRLYMADSGEEHKAFHCQDGLGLNMLQKAGIQLAIITRRKTKSVAEQAKGLGIDHLFQEVKDKAECFEKLMRRIGLPLAAGAFMGDDVVDVPVFLRCGLGLTVPEAPPFVRRRAHYATKARGGNGAVREICELILDAQDKLKDSLDAYLK